LRLHARQRPQCGSGVGECLNGSGPEMLFACSNSAVLFSSRRKAATPNIAAQLSSKGIADHCSRSICGPNTGLVAKLEEFFRSSQRMLRTGRQAPSVKAMSKLESI